MGDPYKDRTVLVTGGTGSFGTTVTKRLLNSGCSEVRIFSRDEAKQDAMRTRFRHDPRLKFYIGDVRERDSVDHAMRDADFVFHAAALKQVPSCEFFPMQAVWTNVIGSHNVVESAIAHRVKKVICLSTDKAVYPVNAMGMTKAIMEKVAQAATRHVRNGDTTICAVRYGNVMYSRGSVIPRFVDQIKSGGPITVTEPRMTRFLLPLIDSVALVKHAFLHGRQGDILIKKAPAATIDTLVRALKHLFDSDVRVSIIGIRHGEKMYETLASREELRRADDHGDFFRIPMDDRDLNYDKYFIEGDPEEIELEDYHSHNTRRLDQQETEALLLTLPEIRSELQKAGLEVPVEAPFPGATAGMATPLDEAAS